MGFTVGVAVGFFVGIGVAVGTEDGLTVSVGVGSGLVLGSADSEDAGESSAQAQSSIANMSSIAATEVRFIRFSSVFARFLLSFYNSAFSKSTDIFSIFTTIRVPNR